MARYTKSTCKLCRREGVKLFLKGDKCYSDKCAMSRRAYAPGQHGQSRKKITNYGTQLREKQKLRRYYGVLERQFERYFEEAERMRGITGDNLLQLLERRLDNVVYRLSIAASRPQARQLVRHGHILVNGKKVDIPSFLVKVGDVITVKDESKSLEVIKNNIETATNIPDWLDFNRDTIEGKILSLPAREHIDLPVEEHLIVELYSR
ncbi:MAG: 30S ribosomal protein S4 [Thermoanaerobacteraceae bacterium]|nr:30S ribosomal protein S4 [Thermoanaerobacteraceae bacterium]